MSKTQITPTLEWDEVFDCAVAAWCRSSTSQEMLRMCFQSRTQQNEVSVGWTANELMAFATGIARLVASPTPPAEQQAQPGAVYAELHEPDATTVGLGAVWNRHSMRDFADRTHALRMQAAPKAAPGVGNSGFDHQTAADFLSGKTVSDEAVRKFVQASRWAHGEKAALSAMLLSVRGVLASREAEIALLKKALLEAEAAPQQEAQEPIGVVEHAQAQTSYIHWTAAPPPNGAKLYTAPQPVPAPLSDDVVKDAARYRWLREGNDAKHGAAWHVAVNLYGCEWDAAIDAARKQGASHDR